jgi:hypothetical protein
MLHTQQSVQQRSNLRDALHVRDQQQQHAQQGEGGVSPSSSPRKGSSFKGSGKFKRRGVVADVCWMLQIKTFEVRPPGILHQDITSTHSWWQPTHISRTAGAATRVSMCVCCLSLAGRAYRACRPDKLPVSAASRR